MISERKEVRVQLINVLDRRRISGWVIKRVTIESQGVAAASAFRGNLLCAT